MHAQHHVFWRGRPTLGTGGGRRSGWRWQRIDERHDDDRVECQLHGYGCGTACVVMLLGDRGIAADQLIVAAGLHLPSVAGISPRA